MADRWTIPAAVLEQLGGLQDEDPPVLHRVNDEHPDTMTWHPLDEVSSPPSAVDSLILPASSPALLRVLERYVGGAPDGVPRLDGPDGLLFWTLRTSRAVSFRHADLGLRGGPMFRVVPTLEGATDPTQALAEVCVWLARVERMVAHNPADLDTTEDEGLGDGRSILRGLLQSDGNPLEALEVMERACGLPAWEVSSVE